MVLLIVGCSSSSDSDDYVEDPAHGLKVDFDIPSELLADVSALTIEENIYITEAEVKLYKDGEFEEPIDSATLEDPLENNEMVFDDVKIGEQYEVQVELKGSIRDQDSEVKTLYQGENTSSTVESDTITTVEVEVDPLNAESLDVSVDSNLDVAEVTLKHTVKEYEKTLTYDDGVLFENGEDLNLIPARWSLIVKLEDQELNIEDYGGREILLLPTEEKEVTLDIDVDVEGDIDVEIIVSVSPDTPTNLRLDDSDHLIWDEQDNIKGYNVYKTETDDPDDVGLPIDTVENNSYSDVEEGYYYWVRAYDSDGHSSGLSESFLIDDEVVTFADQNLENAIREKIDKPSGDILKEDISEVTYLNLSNEGISDLSGLENFTKIEELRIGRNNINDISPLENLIELSYLSMGGNNINDISPLENLIELSHLSMWGNETKDISPLENLTSLSTIIIEDNGINDISSLANLTNLEKISLHYNEVEDLSPLENHVQLNELYLSANKISNISPLENLTDLTELDISHNSELDTSEDSDAKIIINTLKDAGVDVIYEDDYGVEISGEFENAPIDDQSVQLLLKISADGFSNQTGYDEFEIVNGSGEFTMHSGDTPPTDKMVTFTLYIDEDENYEFDKGEYFAEQEVEYDGSDPFILLDKFDEWQEKD